MHGDVNGAACGAIAPSRAGRLHAHLAGEEVGGERWLPVSYPYTGEEVGEVAVVGRAAVDAAVDAMLAGGEPLTRYARSTILTRAAAMLAARAEEFAQLIRAESGLCMYETRYEVGRALDVLQFAAMEALRDDGEIFSCDISAQGKARKIFTLREPVPLVLAISPFNHPLNQVAHKIAPAIAAGAPVLLKPSEKAPLSAIRLAELLFEAGLPGWMLGVFIADIGDVVEPLIRDERVSLVSFTGSTAIGKRIAGIAGYKKLCLELGGCSPLIVLDDADLDLAATLACEGCFRNSGQRCTAVRRVLVHERVIEDFTARFVAKAAAYPAGDPGDERTRVGTVIDEPAARVLEARVAGAVSDGARVLLGGGREGAQMEPTILAEVPRTTQMVCSESFGPLAPILAVSGLDDAIAYANNTPFGLSSGIVTDSLDSALRAVRGIKAGTVNVNQIPGYRIECSPFGGIKDSGLGIKEGVIEAMKFMTTVKTFSLPW